MRQVFCRCARLLGAAVLGVYLLLRFVPPTLDPCRDYSAPLICWLRAFSLKMPHMLESELLNFHQEDG